MALIDEPAGRGQVLPGGWARPGTGWVTTRGAITPDPV
jgi:hypothetical protein